VKHRYWLTLLASLVMLFFASNVGITQSSLVDLENSTGNAFQGWISTPWFQTTQADFGAGVLNNVDTSLSPGDVTLAAISGWYDASWTRRAPLTINNAGSALSGYQVKITVIYDADMQSNFNDIRFTSGDGTTLVSYWRQSYTVGVSAVFWVKVSSIPSGSSTVYMYYGNTGVGSASDGTATFDFFDDFSGGLSKWTIDAENTDKVYISAGVGNPSPSLRHDPDSSQTKNSYFDTRLITKDYKMLNGIIEYEVYLAGSPRIIHQLGWRVQSLNFENGYCWRVQTATSDGGHLRFTGRASWSTFGTAFDPVPANTWHTVKEVVSGATYTGYVDGGSAYSGTNNTKLTADYLVSHVHGVSLDASSYVLVDNIRVRQYASQEPTLGVEPEQDKYVLAGTVAAQVLDCGLSGIRWDAIFWDRTLPVGTAITLEVRAGDVSFDKASPSPSWIPIGAISPITLGLPSGRYEQWRATLATSDASQTPTLHQVIIYHK
jgi:hypothetical protein